MVAVESPPVTTGPGVPARRVPVGLVVVAVAMVCVAAASLLSLLDPGYYGRLGLPEPGALDRLLVTALRATAELGGGLAAGSLLFAAFVAPPQLGGVLDVDGYLAARRGGRSAVVAGLAALLLGPVLAGDLSGTSGPTVLGGDWWALFATLQEPMAWLLCGVVLIVAGVGGLVALRWRTMPLLGALATASLIAPAVVGQAANGAGHDWATDAVILQQVATAVGLGVLVALLAHLHRGGPHRDLVLRRAGRLAAVAAPVLLGSGLVLTVLWIGFAPFGTAWGVVAIVRLAVLAVAAVLGLLLWRSRPGPAVVVLLAGFAVAAVLAVVLERWLPPRFAEVVDTPAESLIGYDLPEPATALRLLLDWRFNILFGGAAIALALIYLVGVRRLGRRGDGWARGRTAAWLCGCAALLVVTSSGVGRYSPGVFSLHMISHMVVNMLVPVLLAMGGPMTLALRALTPAGRGNPPGPREWIAVGIGSRFLRVVLHPLVVLALFVGSFYALYLTGLFDIALRYHWAHQLMNLHFLVIGYLFFWPLIGVDASPTRLPHIGRLAVLLAAMPFHAFFGVAVMSTSTVLGGEFYRLLALPWVGNLLDDQHTGGGIAWAAGEAPMLLVILVLLQRWSRDDAREAARHDRRADADGEADLEAYNAMLARMSGSERS
ncbi:MAG: hypothetical protein JWR81_3223 [Pseudonocardia sp.]|jgi:cytochrome c oxidase assembly factor CtaG|nr:hypothetical protein [Pseudonocardia sp.]